MLNCAAPTHQSLNIMFFEYGLATLVRELKYSMLTNLLELSLVSNTEMVGDVATLLHIQI